MQLIEVPNDPLPWQWHADEPWRDPITGHPTSYLSGLLTREAAIEHGERNGWVAMKSTERGD